MDQKLLEKIKKIADYSDWGIREDTASKINKIVKKSFYGKTAGNACM